MDTKFEFEEVFSFQVNASLVTCSSGETISFQAGYGCNSFNACKTGNTISASLIPNITGSPNLTMAATKKVWPGLTGQPDNGIYQVTNTGNANAYKVKIRLGVSSGVANYSVSKRTYFDFYNFNVNGNTIADNSQDEVSLQFATDPDGSGVGLEDLDGDGFYNDLAASQSFNIEAWLVSTIDFSPLCPENFNSGRWDVIRWNLVYENFCGNSTSYNVVNDSSTNRPLSVSLLNNSVATIKNSSTGSNELTPGATFDLEYILKSSYSSVRTLNIGASDAMNRIKVELPPGVSPNTVIAPTTTATGLTAEAGGVVSFVLNSTLSSPATNTYVYDLVPKVSATLDNALHPGNLVNHGTYKIPLKVDSGCAVNALHEIKVSVMLYEDRDDLVPIIEKYWCATSDPFTLSCITPDGINLSSWSMKRATFGYANTAGTTMVNETTAGIALRNYLDGDKIKSKHVLTFLSSTISSAFLVLRYNQHNWLQDGVSDGGIKGISGTFQPVSGAPVAWTIPL